MRHVRVLSALAAVAVLSACGRAESAGFSLPPGDVETGRQLFADKACNDCHTVSGHDELRAETPPTMNVPLGGPTARVRTYGELVTSIINPSHRVSELYQAEPFAVDGASQMRSYNDVMTVAELIDLVTFLRAQYDLVEYPLTDYPEYRYP